MHHNVKSNFFSKLFWVFIPWAGISSSDFQNIPDLSSKLITLGNKDCTEVKFHFTAQIAKNEKSRERGLGHRKKKLKKDEAMLFIFEEPKILNFWMKNTFIPLQIAYFGLDGNILNKEFMPVEKNPQDPQKNYFSQGLANAALEIAPNTIQNKVETKDLFLCIEK